MRPARPRFSIVVPTRNRLSTLRYCINTCLGQSFDDYEIVISDNGDNDDTKLFVEDLAKKDPAASRKIRYFKNATPCAMSVNFELSVERSTGEYIIVFGDDDGILPRALEEIDKILQDSSEKVIKWANAAYTWPDVSLENSRNYLAFSLERTSTIESGLEQINRSLTSLSYTNLPMLYHNAAVGRDVLDDIRRVGGRVFSGRSPDVYSAFAVAYFCGEFVDVSVPFTVAGLSQGSTGVSAAFEGKNGSPKQDFYALNARDGLGAHPHVPDLPVYPTVVVAESFLVAKENLFPADDRFSLKRSRILEECAKGCDLTNVSNVGLLRAAAADDIELSVLVDSLVRNPQPGWRKPGLRPAFLGADGVNLHLDASDFGVTTVEEAVAIVHKIIWPANAPLRYDLGIVRAGAALASVTEDLVRTRQELVERTEDLVTTRRVLVERTEELVATRQLLVDRTARSEVPIATPKS